MHSDDESEATIWSHFMHSVCRTEVSYLDLFLLSAFLAVRTLNCQRKTPANEAHLDVPPGEEIMVSGI